MERQLSVLWAHSGEALGTFWGCSRHVLTMAALLCSPSANLQKASENTKTGGMLQKPKATLIETGEESNDTIRDVLPSRSASRLSSSSTVTTDVSAGDSQESRSASRLSSSSTVITDVSAGDSQEGVNEVREMMMRLADVAIPITVSDPSLDDNPLIGISPGFTALTGYSPAECVGRNCRFLIDGVPRDSIFESEWEKAREFSQACQRAASMKERSDDDPEDCMCMQRNCCKDGTLFWNMFLMHFVRINGRAYVLGLQHELYSMGDETNQELWQTAVHLKISLSMALNLLAEGRSVRPVFGQIGQGKQWSELRHVLRGLSNLSLFYLLGHEKEDKKHHLL